MKALTRIAVPVALALFGSAGFAPPQAQAGTKQELHDFFLIPESGVRNWPTYSATKPTPADAPSNVLAAGARPNVNIFLRYCPDDTNSSPVDDPFDGVVAGCGADFLARVRDLQLDLPAGMLGNPQNVVPCPTVDYILGGCSPTAQVGQAFTTALTATGNDRTIQDTVPVPIYAIQTLGMEPARLGTDFVPGLPTPTDVLVSLRTETDFGVRSLTLNVPAPSGGTTQIVEQRISLFSHARNADNTVNLARPFMTNPTSCEPATATARVNSIQEPDEYAEKAYTFQPDPSSCDAVDFDPSLGLTPAVNQQASPSAYEVKINLPNSELKTIHDSHLKTADVTLPEGVGLNPAAGKTLEGCNAEQFFRPSGGNGDSLDVPNANANRTNLPSLCPSDSQTGTLQVATPILPDPDPATEEIEPQLFGKAYFATPRGTGRPTDANPWWLFQEIEGQGIRIKLAGKVTLSETGRISTVFENLPQTPFTAFTLKLQGGERSVLRNPRRCEPTKADVDLTGYNGDVVKLEPEVTSTGCTSPEPFDLSVAASSQDESAGASSPSRIEVNRTDASALLKNLKLDLPAGLVGSLKAAPLCSAASARAGTCSAESKVGNLRVHVGGGESVLQVPGSLYIAEPTEAGDVATLSAVIDTKVGPIDLGSDVVVLNHVKLRQSDGGLTVISEDFPTRLEGIDLPVRRIDVDVDKEGFLRNPTGCEPRALNGTFNPDAGAATTASVMLTAKNCERLPFSPRLRLIVPGGLDVTRKGRVGISNHTPLTAIVTQNPGEASIRRAEVLLPTPIRPDTGVLNKPGVLCTTAQATINACRPQSQVGTANVITPLLPEPLSGPVYIVQDPGNVLPKLLVQLRGMASIDLVAGNRIAGVRTVNTFDGVPDVPQSRFELKINGGPGGILFNFSELCDAKSTADAKFSSHSGKTVTSKPQLEVEACGRISAFRIKRQRIRVTSKRIARVKVDCPQGRGDDCAGLLDLSARMPRGQRKRGLVNRRIARSARFTIAAGKSKRIRLKISQAAFRHLRAKKRVTGRIQGKAGRSGVSGTVTLLAPRQRRR